MGNTTTKLKRVDVNLLIMIVTVCEKHPHIVHYIRHRSYRCLFKKPQIANSALKTAGFAETKILGM